MFVCLLVLELSPPSQRSFDFLELVNHLTNDIRSLRWEQVWKLLTVLFVGIGNGFKQFAPSEFGLSNGLIPNLFRFNLWTALNAFVGLYKEIIAHFYRRKEKKKKKKLIYSGCYSFWIQKLSGTSLKGLMIQYSIVNSQYRFIPLSTPNVVASFVFVTLDLLGLLLLLWFPY